ncbi:MAG: hypothetical protein U0P45_09955 [Acidimicrobiales bacterium]
MPRGPDETWDEVRALLGARPGGFEEGDELAVVVGDRRLYVAVLPYGPDAAVVQVMAPILAGVANSDDLCLALATSQLAFTKPLVFDDDGGRTVLLVLRFHADQLRGDVLDFALAKVAAEAGVLDPALEGRFGATWTLEGPA